MISSTMKSLNFYDQIHGKSRVVQLLRGIDMATKKAAPKKSTPARALNTLAVSPRKSSEERRWQAQDDLRTLQRAQEIQRDKARLTACQSEARQQMSALSKVAK